MTVVYVDLLFLLNFAANYLLLLLAGRICGRVICRSMAALGAAAGALYSAVVFLPGLEWLAQPPCKLVSALLMVLLAYGGQRGLIRILLAFWGASAGLGGMIFAAELMGGHSLTLERGVLYSHTDIRLMLLLLMGCYCLFSGVFGRSFQHTGRQLAPVTVEAEGHTLTLTALLDTGNTLTDPVTNRPVLVADGAAVRELLPMKLALERPVEALADLDACGVRGWRLLPYRAVGVSCGMLLALRAERVTVGQRDYGSILVALSPTPVSDGGAYQALIGGSA